MVRRDAPRKQNDDSKINKDNDDKDILEVLLENKMNDIKSKINDEFLKIFDDVNEILDGKQTTDSITSLREVLPELKILPTQKEILLLNQIKNKELPKIISNFSNLSQDVILLANKIDGSIQNLS